MEHVDSYLDKRISSKSTRSKIRTLRIGLGNLSTANPAAKVLEALASVRPTPEGLEDIIEESDTGTIRGA